jgi:sirohydrochlorin cobaltochelatase
MKRFHFIKHSGWLLFLFSMLMTVPSWAQGEETAVSSDMIREMNPSDKAAILLVSFGTTHDDTRAVTIDALYDKVKKAYPQITVARSFTSRIILRRLKARGIEFDTPIEAMLKLRAEGITHLVVQSTNIIEGEEMESLRRDVETMKPFFKEIRVGTPLLYSTEDALHVMEILTRRHPVNEKQKEHVLFVGHGTEGPATAIYSQLDYMMKVAGNKNFHVATIEGYPTQDDALRLIQAAKGKKVTLVPLMFVAGDHAKNDISVDWKEALEAESLKVQLCIEGLGEIPEIQDVFMEHLRFALTHRIRDIMEKKAVYAGQTD